MRFFKSSLLAGLVLILLLAVPAQAQETGQITGTVTDPDGAPLPGVAVTIGGSLVPESTVYTQSNGHFRFVALPPGNDYSLTFALEGFATIVQEQIAVRVGGNTSVSVAMELSTVEETVTVTGTTPIVDVKDTSTGANITEEYMQSIPSARDPWVMLEHTAGVQTDRANVGGSESGQQSGISSRGAMGFDSVWTYDGAEITDMAATGASTTYFDFGAFEEIDVTTGGADPSKMTGGVQINFVTKRGGNNWRGSGRFFVTDEEFQSENIDDVDGTLFPGFSGGNRISNIKDYGAEVGGPVLEDRFYVWGAYGTQRVGLLVGDSTDDTQLENWHAKGTFHLTGSTVMNYTFMRANKSKQGRGASATRPQETTFNQGGPSPVHTGKLQHTFNDNNYAEVSVSRVLGGFFLEPQGGRDAEVLWNLDTGVWSGSYFFYDTERPQWNVKVDANSYVAEALGGDHEFKYGYNYRTAETESFWGLPGGQAGVLWPGQDALTGGDDAYRIRFQALENDHTKLTRQSLYAGDTYSNGRWTVNLGLRYDDQKTEELEGFSPGNPIAPVVDGQSTMPDLTFDGRDPGFSWSSLSPRVGITYDVSGDASTVVKLVASRYFSQMGTNETAFFAPTGVARVLNTGWNDLDGDGSIDPGEAGEIQNWNSGWDPFNPDLPSPNVVDATDPPFTDELIFGVEHEINRSLGIGANAIYRKNGRHNWAPPVGIGPDDWFPVQDSNAGVDFTYYDTASFRPNGEHYREHPDFHLTYRALELTMTKRFSDRWMGNVSYTYADWENHWESPAGYPNAGDATNVEQQDGRQASAVAGGSGIQGILFGSANHHFKASGMYRLPGGVNLAGFFQVRDGYISPTQVRSSGVRTFDADDTAVLTGPVGDERLETFWQVDLRVEKAFNLAGVGRLHVMADGFNIFNNATVLNRVVTLDSANYGAVTRTHSPRVFRFGARLVLQ